jgi:hypothetical protein
LPSEPQAPPTAKGIAHGTAPAWKAAARASRRIAQAIEVCARERACARWGRRRAARSTIGHRRCAAA